MAPGAKPTKLRALQFRQRRRTRCRATSLQHWTFAGPGWAVEVSLLYIGRRARSDQYRVMIDGREWSACAGVSETLAHLRQHVIPRTASRRQRDECRQALVASHQGYSELDEAGAADRC